ncbi:MAG TPA: hypothetical protein VNZ86_03535 [Bacteroidia bacterium]|jgi:hypothetical protein|nr:hypothetical protein [Bacteroidia bacterium]
MKAYWLMGFAFLGAYAITSLPIFSIAFFLSVLMILFWAIRFFSAKGRYIRRVNSDKTTEYEFRYSESGICYKNADYETNLAWSHFGFYEINGNAIYLYGKSNNLVDIISERICGQEHFMALKQLIETAVLKR